MDEYRDLSKDGSGQWRRGARHKGYFVVEVAAPTKKEPNNRAIEVRPVYAHRSPEQTRMEFQMDKKTRVLGYFESGCLIQIDTHIGHPKTPLKPGVYRLNTMRLDGYVRVTNNKSEQSQPIGLDKFVAAGFRRAE